MGRARVAKSKTKSRAEISMELDGTLSLSLC